MTPKAAKAQIINSLQQYDDGIITRSSMLTVIDTTITEACDTAFLAGQATVEDDGEEYEVEFFDDNDEPLDD